MQFSFGERFESWSSRLSIAIIYTWFGLLKLIGSSPANELVTQTVRWVPPKLLLPLLGSCELMLGIGILIPAFVPVAMAGLCLHLVATTMPLIFLPGICFAKFGVPTLIGQYIVKNLLTASLMIVIYRRCYFQSSNPR